MMSLLTHAGQTEVTEIPKGASSRRRDSAMTATADFVPCSKCMLTIAKRVHKAAYIIAAGIKGSEQLML